MINYWKIHKYSDAAAFVGTYTVTIITKEYLKTVNCTMRQFLQEFQ